MSRLLYMLFYLATKKAAKQTSSEMNRHLYDQALSVSLAPFLVFLVSFGAAQAGITHFSSSVGAGSIT